MEPMRGKVALITGGSSGIGRGTALGLAKLGAAIAVASRNEQALQETAGAIRNAGAQALIVPTDVTDSDQCRRAIEATVEHFGRLDILVCSAGVSMRAYLEHSNLAAMDRVMRVNFFGTLYATYYAIAHVKKTRGSLVAISSLTGKRGIPSYSIYGASKFAVQGLYDSLRVELLHDGVHVGVVSPGFVDTPLRERVLGPDGKPWDSPPAPPFRIWSVDRCIDHVVRLILKRKAQALLPAYIRHFLTVDQMLGGWLGDRILARRFPPEKH